MLNYQQNALTNIDSYKLGHARMYPEGTTEVYSNLTPRSDRLFKSPAKDGKMVWVGMQAFLHTLVAVWKDTFFDRPKAEVCKEFADMVAPFCGPNGFDITHLELLWDLGYLPIRIKSLPEGSRVPMGVPVMTIKNTLAPFYWLVNYLETWLSADLWKTCTAATITDNYRRILEVWREKTGGSKEFADWQIHDFSPRGMSGMQDAARTGFGHLTCSLGTDNIPSVLFAKQLYKGNETFVAGSVPASEHSVSCTNISYIMECLERDGEWNGIKLEDLI